MHKIFFIADTHFGHQNIIEYENRPFADANKMDEELIKKWNNKVSKTDKIYVLGDFSFHKEERTKEILSQLNGHKVLIMGNHDRGKNIKHYYDIGFQEVYKHPIIINNFIVLSHEPPEYYNNNTPYFYLYGHVHSTPMYKTLTKESACVSCERWDYEPLELERLKTLLTFL